MEPRIQSLINPILLGRNSDEEAHFLRNLPSQRPIPVEPHYAIEELSSGPDNVLHGRIPLYEPLSIAQAGTSDGLQPLRPRPNIPPSGRKDGKIESGQGKSSVTSRVRSKHAVPIAEVLNQQPENNEKGKAARGGSLNDILLNSPRKRKRNEDVFGADASNDPEQLNRNSQANGGSSLLTLPKPQTVRKKTSRRLPPLLQGLHQPPPDAGLFPRITEKEEHPERSVTAAIVEKEVEKEQNHPLPSLRPLEEETEPLVSEPSSQEKSKATTKASVDSHNRNPNGKLKRHKWSDEETANLLKGVAKYGIGSWKKILECKDYKFSQRTAVDLKDRFRTCRPSDYCKPKTATSDLPIGETQPSTTHPTPTQGKYPIVIPERPKKKPRSGTHRKGADDLAKIGIAKPFEKNARRERRPFSKKEDEALLQGYQKHNSKWFLIKNDPTLGLDSRHPTDLRDRFRNRFPDEYKAAVTKIKSKEGADVVDHEGLDKPDQKSSKPKPDPLITGKSNDTSPQSSTAPAATRKSTSKTSSTSHPSLYALTTHFPEMNMSSYNDDSGDEYSPVTLSRNILGWADAHLPNLPSLHAPLSLTTTEQSSILAQATTSSFSQGITMSMLMSNDPFSPINPPTSSAISTSAPSNHTSSRTQHSQGLPSLSTLTLPSAGHSRGPTLNLPPPSDILSGYDDSRLDSHNHAFLWGDGALT